MGYYSFYNKLFVYSLLCGIVVVDCTYYGILEFIARIPVDALGHDDRIGIEPYDNACTFTMDSSVF